MDWKWAEDLLEDYYQHEVNEARTCIPGFRDDNGPVSHWRITAWRISGWSGQRGLAASKPSFTSNLVRNVWQTRRQTQAFEGKDDDF